MFDLLPLAKADPRALDSLLDGAFGTDRHLRTAYRVREGSAPIEALCFAACEGVAGRLVGSIQGWPVALTPTEGESVPMIMVGPVAVHPERQERGIGRALVRRLIDTARASTLPGREAMMLIGDPEYYGRHFGFSAERTGAWSLPGPFERHRLLALGTQVPDAPGVVAARLPAIG